MSVFFYLCALTHQEAVAIMDAPQTLKTLKNVKLLWFSGQKVINSLNRNFQTNRKICSVTLNAFILS